VGEQRGSSIVVAAEPPFRSKNYWRTAMWEERMMPGEVEIERQPVVAVVAEELV
jgi:hypothetical protein